MTSSAEWSPWPRMCRIFSLSGLICASRSPGWMLSSRCSTVSRARSSSSENHSPGSSQPAAPAVPDDGRADAIAQVLQVALEGRRRYLERLQKLVPGHDAAALQEVLDLVEAFGTVHAALPARFRTSVYRIGTSQDHGMSHRVPHDACRPGAPSAAPIPPPGAFPVSRGRSEPRRHQTRIGREGPGMHNVYVQDSGTGPMPPSPDGPCRQCGSRPAPHR